VVTSGPVRAGETWIRELRSPLGPCAAPATFEHLVGDRTRDLVGLQAAFYIGQSHEVGGTTTDMVAFAHDDVLVQVWIGVKDKLPRRSRAIYSNDPAQLRHQMDLSGWPLDVPVPAGTFTSARASRAKRIPFARPEPAVPPGPPPPAGSPSKSP
jgi:hypothetical protein